MNIIEQNEAEILEKAKTGVHRTPEERKLARAWADERGIPYNTRGKFPERIFMEYIKENYGKPQEILSSEWYKVRRDNTIHTTVEIWCNLCGTIHTHGGFVGQRGDTGHRVAHCSNTYTEYADHGYHLVDNRPVEEWEVNAMAHNEKVIGNPLGYVTKA